jgi:hypothetical protein
MCKEMWNGVVEEDVGCAEICFVAAHVGVIE